MNICDKHPQSNPTTIKIAMAAILVSAMVREIGASALVCWLHDRWNHHGCNFQNPKITIAETDHHLHKNPIPQIAAKPISNLSWNHQKLDASVSFALPLKSPKAQLDALIRREREHKGETRGIEEEKENRRVNVRGAALMRRKREKHALMNKVAHSLCLPFCCSKETLPPSVKEAWLRDVFLLSS